MEVAAGRIASIMIMGSPGRSYNDKRCFDDYTT